MLFTRQLISGLLLPLALGLPTVLFGQISATVTDAATQAPLPFVGIYLQQDHSVGLLADDGGRFTIGAGVDLADGDTLIFQQLGYRTRRLSVGQLRNMTTVPLVSAAIELSTITVKPEDYLRRLIREADAAIAENYLPRKSVLLPAYFRKYSLQDGEVVERIEAQLYIKDKGYRSARQPFQVYLVGLNRTEDGRQLPIHLRDMGFGPWALNDYFNVARSRNYHTLATNDVENFLDHFTFRDLGIYVDGSDTLQRIGYDTKGGPLYFDEEGVSGLAAELVINLADRAIVRVTKGNPENAYAREFNTITYRKVGDRYFPLVSHHSFGYSFNDGNDFIFEVDQLIFLPEQTFRRRRDTAHRGKRIEKADGLRRQDNQALPPDTPFGEYRFDHLLPRLMRGDSTWVGPLARE